jgi:outer membrane immunogenic protein
MSKVFGSIALLALVTAPAMAADLPLKAPPPPVYSWTGLYVGGNVGYGWGNARTDIAGSGTAFSFAGIAPGFAGFPTSVGVADSNTTRPNSFIAGFQLGYNYQFSPAWVAGFEADIQRSGHRGSSMFADPFSATICADFAPPTTCTATAQANGVAITTHEATIGWFGTVRGRLGALITDQLLVYGTGGLAYGQANLSSTINIGGLATTPLNIGVTFPFATGTLFSESKTRLGFAVGGGIEGKGLGWLPAGWTWRLEYLHVDLGSFDAVGPFPPASH